jgi:pilus assembly protein Flp/PilA
VYQGIEKNLDFTGALVHSLHYHCPKSREQSRLAALETGRSRIYGLWEDGMTKWFKDVLVELHREESGQDLIEYALIAALIALAATVGMGAVATAINEAFSSIGAKLKAYAS